MAPHQEGQTGVWTHRWKFVYFSARYSYFLQLIKNEITLIVTIIYTCLTLGLPSGCISRVMSVNIHIIINLFILSCLGCKSQKHVLRPESLEGTDEEDPVSALEWDLLSTDYLLGWTKGVYYNLCCQ